jgi:septal ring factor EnvC (AmiA/AmiB activator)
MATPDEHPHDSNADPSNITEERAARRFHQIRHMERNLTKIDKRISDAKTKLQTLKEQREAQIVALFEAARDEGDLPLFDDLD